MRRPSVPLIPALEASTARARVASQMLPMLRDLERRATASDLQMLAYVIDCAIIEAERAAKSTDAT